MLTSGTVLAQRYRVEALHALGGMSEVYLAMDLTLQRRVAIKTPRVLSDRVDEQDRYLEQFRSEALILGSLEHPNLAKVLDLVEEQGKPHMVMQFIDGQDLHQEVTSRTRRVSESEALEWSRQILDALEYLHGRTPAVIVRDLKPSNIIRSVDGHLYVTDFGLAKYYDPNSNTRSIVRGLGSQGYAPLEQGAATTDQRTDLYAFGATLLFVLTGQDPPEASARVTHGAPLCDPRTVNPSVSHRVWDVIQRLMAVVPRERPGSVSEARKLLLAPGPTKSAPLTSPTHDCPPATPHARSARDCVMPPRQESPTPVWVVLVAVALCLVLWEWHAVVSSQHSSPNGHATAAPTERIAASDPQATPRAARRAPSKARVPETTRPTPSVSPPESQGPDSPSSGPEIHRPGGSGLPSPTARPTDRTPASPANANPSHVYVGRLVEYTGGSQMRQLTITQDSTWRIFVLRVDTTMIACDLNEQSDLYVGAVVNVLATGGHDDLSRAHKVMMIEPRPSSMGDGKVWAASEILRQFLVHIRRGAYHEAFARLSLKLTESEFQETVQAHEAYGTPRHTGPDPVGADGFIVDVYFRYHFSLVCEEGRWTITRMTFDLDSQARPTDQLGPIR